MFWAAILDECQKLLWGTRRVWEEAKQIEWLMVCPYITAAHVQGTWQEFHTFYYSKIKKLCWCWKTCQKHVASLSHVTNISFRKCDFIQFLGQTSKLYKIGKHAQLKHFSHFSSKRQACLLQHIKMVKPPDKRPGISDMGRLFCIFVALISIRLAETVRQHSSGWAASKACWLTW